MGCACKNKKTNENKVNERFSNICNYLSNNWMLVVIIIILIIGLLYYFILNNNEDDELKFVVVSPLNGYKWPRGMSFKN
jgi:hypothetical protein